MEPFANQMRQVAVTYLSRRWLVLAISAMVVVFGGLPLISYLDRPLSFRTFSPPAVTIIGLPAMLFSMLLTFHAKVQFADPRSTVVPNFAAAHLAVVALILGVLLVVYPMLVALSLQWNPLGLSAFAIAIAIPMIWAFHLNQGRWVLISMGLFYSAFTDLGLRWWILASQALVPVHMVIILSGWAAAVAWLWRLSHLREEMGDYEVPIIWRSERPSRAESVALRNLVGRRFGRGGIASAVVDWWHARLPGGYDGSFRSKVWLLSYGLSTVPPGLLSLIAGCILLAFSLLFGALSFLGRSPSDRAMVFPIQMALLVPCIFPLTILVQHRPQMPRELLLPMSRAEFIDGLFAAIARVAVLLWITAHVVLALLLVIIPNDKITPAAAGMFLLLSASLGVVNFGLGAYLVTWKSLVQRMIALWFCLMPLIMLLASWWWLRETTGDLSFAILPLLLVALGVGIIRRARAKWLALELG